MNTLGLIAAISAFLTIWFGHVTVRKIEFISPTIWLPTLLFATAGFTLEWLSLSTFNLHLSIVLGIVGITLLFDALEFTRQQRRIRKGHAPANSHNPRHAKIMAECPTATTADLLKHNTVSLDNK